jgi:tetratricopeptide (TPR) repeat protein
MAIRVETVADLLDAREWVPCADLAARAVSDGVYGKEHEAFLNFALCRSLSNQDKYSTALEPGHRAVYLAEEVRDYDLLGRALIELAWVHHKLPDLARQAVHTQRRYFDHFENYREPAKRHYLWAMLNLGVYLRAADEHQEALEQFLRAFEAAKARKEWDVADTCRRNAVGQAVLLQQLGLAERLIEQGTDYINKRPADDKTNASHLLDLAQVSLLRGDTAEATALAMEAAVRARRARINNLCARAFEVLHRIGKITGEYEGALAVAIIAKMQAEEDERHDLVSQIRVAVKEIALRDPGAVSRFMREVTGIA